MRAPGRNSLNKARGKHFRSRRNQNGGSGGRISSSPVPGILPPIKSIPRRSVQGVRRFLERPIQRTENLPPASIEKWREIRPRFPLSPPDAPWIARQSPPGRLSAAMGFPCTSAQAFTAVRPTRSPVNDPGPEATANTSILIHSEMCPGLQHFDVSKKPRRIWGFLALRKPRQDLAVPQKRNASGASTCIYGQNQHDRHSIAIEATPLYDKQSGRKSRETM